MTELLIGLALIVILYARTFRYKRLIDDAVPMSGYLYNVPQSSPAPSFFLETTPWWHRVLAIGLHMMNTWLVYLLLGGKAALLFAVFPVSVNNVAWITGSYYSCTTMLTLISFYFLTHTPWWVAAPVAMATFALALNTTVATIAFPFVFLFGNPLGLVTLIPLAGFLVGKRFTVGKKIREGNFNYKKVSPDTFTVGRLAVMTKVVALYLYTALVPLKLCFFRSFGARYRIDPELKKDMDSFNALFWASVALITSFVVVGALLGKLFWVMWFLILMAAFSQYKILGQFFAERYMYPAIIGICVLFAQLPDPVYWVLVGLYIMRTHMFIPVFENNRELYLNGIKEDPKEGSNYCNISDWYLMVDRDLTLAGNYMQRNMQVDPTDYKPHVNFASLWRILKNYPNAKYHIEKAKELADGCVGEHIMGIIDNQLMWVNRELEGGDSKKE